MHREAAGFRAAVDSGSAIGRLEVPRLGVDMVMVEGTASDDLKRGPGRDERTFMPGEGKLVYVAGHRTTYSAPFARIDALRPGDRITVEMPYGTFAYTVTRHRIVDDQDLSVLRSGPGEELALQACHPRFFATQRYIVWAKPARPRSADGRVYALPDSS
jgi:sortase A